MKTLYLYYAFFFTGIIVFFGFAYDIHENQKYSYDDFETPEYCKQCHNLFFQQ